MPLRFHTSWLLWTLLLLPNARNDEVEGAFSGSLGEAHVVKPAALTSKSNAMWRVSTSVDRTLRRSHTGLFAKPERLQENVEGVVYVNDRVSRCRSMHYAPPVCYSFYSNVTSSLSRLHCNLFIHLDPYFSLTFILSSFHHVQYVFATFSFKRCYISASTARRVAISLPKHFNAALRTRTRTTSFIVNPAPIWKSNTLEPPSLCAPYQRFVSRHLRNAGTVLLTNRRWRRLGVKQTKRWLAE
jgi:hypothetical protein